MNLSFPASYLQAKLNAELPPPLEIVEEEIHKRLLSGGSVPVGETETEMVPEGVLHVALGDAEVPLGLPGFAAAGALVQGHIVGRRELRVELGL